MHTLSTSRPSGSIRIASLVVLLAAACSADNTTSETGAADTSAAGDTHTADAAGDANPADTPDATVPDTIERVDVVTHPPAAVRGTARIFGPPGGPLEGATITLLEHPSLSTTTDSDGDYEFLEVPAGDVTPVLQREGYAPNQLGTFTLAGEDLEDMDFQAVSDEIFHLFGLLAEVEPDPATCQVSTTVTRWFEDSLPVVHGEPNATATMTPDAGRPAIYFNEDVLPTPGLTETSVDGGVVWTNVPPGDYVIEAHKPDVDFVSVRIRCRAGFLVNAGPPRGLQALNPGNGY